MAINPALEIFRRLETLGLAEIHRMRDEQEQETVFLDFKNVSSQDHPMQPEDRKTLGEALSGFANADGGVIVWGVDCRKGSGQDDPDVVQDLRPIRHLRRWLSDLHSYEHQVVSPPVEGVRHHSIDDPVAGADTGYAVTYVPRSEGQPHMAIAKIKEQYSYYVRAGASFIKMPHTMVADRFGRRPHPSLKLFLRVMVGGEKGQSQSLTRTYRLIVGIHNAGRGLAHYPGIALALAPNMSLSGNGIGGENGLPFVRQSFNPLGPHTASYRFAGGADHVIHPGTTREVAEVTCDVSLWQRDVSPEKIALGYELYCDGDSVRGLTEITVGEVQGGKEFLLRPGGEQAE